jgi:hypothetical protein
MRFYLPSSAPDSLTAALYVHDDNHGVNHQAVAQPLTPGQWHILSYQVPPLTDACLSQVGVVVHNLGEVWETGSFGIESLDWGGEPDFITTFSKERPESSGISQWTRVRGYWRLEDGAYHGSGVGLCETYTGDLNWQNYTVEAEIMPLIGDHHLVLARVQGASCSYAFGLAPDGRIALSRKDGQPECIAETPFAWKHGGRYTLTMTVREDELSCDVKGADGTSALLTVRDSAFSYGQIGLATWHGGHMAVHSVSVRPARA